MGIEMASFRNAASAVGEYVELDRDDMTKVVASNLKDVKDEKLALIQNSNDANDAANNIYIRGQLLEDIRSRLLSSRLMSVGRDSANRSKDILLFQNKDVQRFFEKAEESLFGDVVRKGAHKGQYGVETASQKLKIETVHDLLAEMDALLPHADKLAEDKRRADYANRISKAMGDLREIDNVNNLGAPENAQLVQEHVEGETIPELAKKSVKEPVKGSVVTINYEYKEHDDFSLLPGKTVKSDWVLYDAPEELKRNQELIKTKFPSATKEQRDFVLSLDANLSFGDSYKLNCRKLCTFMGLDASFIGRIQISDVAPATNGRDLVCTLAVPGGVGGIKVLVGTRGELYGYEDYQKVHDVLGKRNLIADDLTVGLDAADYSTMNHYLKSVLAVIDDVAQDEEKCEEGTIPKKDARTFGPISSNDLTVAVFGQLLTVVPKVRERHPETPPEKTIPYVWEELKLKGNPPESGDPQGFEKLVMGMCRRFAGDFIEFLGVQGDGDFQQYFNPGSLEEFENTKEKLGAIAKSRQLSQLLKRFLNPEGLTYDEKLAFLKGNFDPKLADVRSKYMKPVPMSSTGESLIMNSNPKSVKIFKGSRQSGTTIKLGTESLITFGSETAEKNPQTAVAALRGKNYSFAQIFQLDEYLNNPAMNLLCSLGVEPDQRNCDLTVLSGDVGKEGGDMVVRATMPVVRYHCLGKLNESNGMRIVDKRQREEVIHKITNQNIVQEFVIHRDGTMEAKDFKIVSTNRTLKYCTVKV